MKFSIATIILVAAPLGAQNVYVAPPDAALPRVFPGVFAFSGAGTGGQSFLGVGVAEVTSNRAKELKLKEEHGVEVTGVEDGSAAAKAGVKVGDVVLEYNGQRVEGSEQFIRLVRETPTGREVKLLISRNGAPQTVPVVMGSRKPKMMVGHDTGWVPPIAMPDLPRVFTSWTSPMLGLEVESLTRQLGEFFGVKEGVLVRSVMPGSAAAKAGIRAGDVLVKVDQTSVATPAEVTSAVHAASSKKTFPIVLMRDKRETTVHVTVEEDSQDGEMHRVRPRARPVKM